MTTEQKEAIEKLQQKLNPKEFGGYCVLGYNQKYCFGKSEVEAIETVLSLIQKQEKEIEKYKKLYQKALDDAVVTAHDNMQKDKIIDELAKEQLKKQCEIADERNDLLVKIQELQKQIDLMAEEIRKTILIVKPESKFCQYEEDCKNIRCKDCIKQFFEKQARRII